MPCSSWKNRSAYIATRKLNTLIHSIENELWFTFDGKLDGKTVQSFAPILEEILNDGIHKIVFDLHQVVFLDFEGVTLIRNTYLHLSQTSGGLVCLPSKMNSVNRILQEHLNPSTLLSFEQDQCANTQHG